jgi:hypothetical protein
MSDIYFTVFARIHYIPQVLGRSKHVNIFSGWDVAVLDIVASNLLILFMTKCWYGDMATLDRSTHCKSGSCIGYRA